MGLPYLSIENGKQMIIFEKPRSINLGAACGEDQYK
jgi:hypothetical protein